MKTCQLHCTLYVSNLGYTLGVYRSTGISVSDKVYEDLSATVFPGVSASNPGYNSLSPGMFFLVYFVADRYSLVYTLGDRPL